MTGERAGGNGCELLPSNDQSVSPGHDYSTSSAALADSETTTVPNDEVEALDPGDRSCAEILLDIVTEAELFHAADGTEFADIIVNGHRETWPIRSNGFKRWLARQFFALTTGAPNATAVNTALLVIQARAHYDGPEREVHVRVAGHCGRLYLDLADPAWRVVEIAADGWRIVDSAPVRFRREPGMRALPDPKTGGSIDALRPFLNLGSDEDFVLLVSWLLAAFLDRGPYPVLVLRGEQGSAKSSHSELFRDLLDPNSAPIRSLPRDERDLFIAATRSHLQAFDNVSRLLAWLSDALCRLSTGGGFGTRRLRTDQDEILFDGARPVILNGIDDIVSRPDLADRAVFLTLSPIPPHLRRAEQEFWAAFESVRPQILGVLLDALAHGLGMLPETRLDGFPRMADFALWATACETAFWKPGTFIAAYSRNVDEAVEDVIEADPVASAVRQFAASRSAWTGTASALLRCLEQITEPSDRRGSGWPTTARALSGRLRRAATPLRKLGIEIAFERHGHARTRTIAIVKGQGPSASSAPSAGSTARGGRQLRPSTDKSAPAVRKESGRRGAKGLKARLRTERTMRTQKHGRRSRARRQSDTSSKRGR